MTGLITVCFISLAILFACLIKALFDIKDLTEKNQTLEFDLDKYRYEAFHLRWLLRDAERHKASKEIPKGTIQAVKEAMKRSHPDNGGSTEDFQMYRRAYNILTGKEKI